ncbi:MAG: helix-turn-helix domain-containing protein [Terriglobales bacterium]
MSSRLKPARLVAGTGPRRVPSQARGRERVERLLAAAAAEIGRRGYAEATMSAIARRAGTAIGSLYQFYPNKEALAETLRARYAAAAAPLWRDLAKAAPQLTTAQLARELVQVSIEMIERCPVFAALVDAPRTEGSNRRRQQHRRRLAAVLRAGQPGLAPAQALSYAAVVQYVLRGVPILTAARAPELEELLAGYLKPRLEGPQ